jgi:hypothetical protein
MGEALRAAKKLNGARFLTPPSDLVDSQPIGRGTTSDVISS